MNGGKHYTWDEAKRRSNYAKHKMDFAAMHRFNWQTAQITLTEEPTEERWLAVGFIDLTLCVVVYTERGEETRIISLRKATRRESYAYATR